ncbi:MAG: response regulator [Candidatus Omnitrophica bacterium]|nr:response regulator [Candidatus Omnitrophota bacterium]
MMMTQQAKETNREGNTNLSGTDPVKILIVDDLKDNLLALEGLLRRDDVNIFKARSGSEALELMIAHEFALALIDVQMPGMSGFELAELMRGTRKTKNIPLIFVTATAQDQSFLFKGYERGAVDFLLKPLNTHTVKSKVNIFIELYRQRKELEKLLADREKLAREQIHIRTKAMESTVEGIFIIDVKKPDFRVIYANPSFYSQTGYAAHEVIGKDFFALHRDDAALCSVFEMKEVIGRGKSFQGEMQNLRKNGENFWSSLRLAPVRDISGDITHYVGTQTDTTLMKQKDLKIEEQREVLLHITRVGKLAEFVASLAHEISQPLTAILSYAQGARRMLADREPQVSEILQYIANDDQRAAEVIRRLRALLKKNKPAVELLDINVLITDTITLIMTHITVRNKVIKFELAGDLPFIHGDRIQLQQVLLNLISNSLEAMDERRDSSELLIRTLRKDNAMIMVEVTDSGCGIPAENMDQLFVHFFTSKADGLGMGLSISRSIVEGHGGRLEARNNPEQGATFYFTLPVGAVTALTPPVGS